MQSNRAANREISLSLSFSLSLVETSRETKKSYTEDAGLPDA
jgi:hypothetical protein